MKSWITKNWHIVLLGMWCLTPLIWYFGKGSAIINGLDTNFPLNPEIWFRRRFFVWNDTLNAGVDASSSTSGWFFHLVQYVPYKLGLDLQLTQMFSLVFWFSMTILSSYYFAKSLFSNDKLANIIFVFIYSFNIYLFNTWENVKVANLALVVGIPLFLGLLQRFYRSNISYSRLLLLSMPFAIVTAGSGINPAYYISMVGVIIVYILTYWLFNRSQSSVILKGGLTIVTLLVLLNLYWMLPFLRYLLISAQAASFEDIGFANWIYSLSENTSLLNVLRLQGAWDWYTVDGAGTPLYIPYASNYFYNSWFIVFSFVVPFLALTSLVFVNRKKNYLYIYAIIVAIIGVFMGAGVHPPTGVIFEWASKYIPYFSFFRSPWYIFTPYLILAYALLLGLLVSHIEDRAEKLKTIQGIPLRTILFIGVLVFIGVRSLYLYPIIEGKIFRPDKSDSFFVTFPDYVFKASEYIDSTDPNVRLISYPDEQLESFEWGYRGTESILNLLSNKEVITPSFAFVSRGMESLLSKFYLTLKRGEYQTAVQMLPYFNANGIYYKNDSSSIRLLEDIDQISTAVTSIGEWDFYTIDNEVQKISAKEGIYINQADDDTFSSLTAFLDNEYLEVDSEDSVLKQISEVVPTEYIIKAEKEDVSEETKVFTFSVPEESEYTLVFDRNNLKTNDITIFSPTPDLNSLIVRESEGYFVSDPIVLSAGEHTLQITCPTSPNIVNPQLTNTIIDFYMDKQLYVGDELVQGGYDSNGDYTIVMDIDNYDPYSDYIISFDSKYDYGDNITMEFAQRYGQEYLRIENIILDKNTEYEVTNYEYNSVPLPSGFRISISAAQQNIDRFTRYQIKNISMKKKYEGALYLFENNGTQEEIPSLEFEKISSVEYRVRVRDIGDNYLLSFSENYSPDWVIKGEDVGKPLHFTANGFGNAWFMPGTNSDQEFTIYYKGQSYYRLGVVITISTILAVLFVTSKHRMNK